MGAMSRGRKPTNCSKYVIILLPKKVIVVFVTAKLGVKVRVRLLRM